MAARRRAWLYQLRELVHDHGARGLWDLLYDDLLAGGMYWRTAFPIARRRIKLGILLLYGLEQAEAAARLGVSLRTVGSDTRALRRAISRAPGEQPSTPPAGRVPSTPEEVPAEHRSSRR
jgi:hypothetical protein